VSFLEKNQSKNLVKSNWIENVKQYLCETGFSGVLYAQWFSSRKWLIKANFQKLKDIYIQSWRAEINDTSDSYLYKYIKDNFCLLCIAVPMIRMMTLTLWKSENLFIEVVLVYETLICVALW
jgi:hypothetical protein